MDLAARAVGQIALAQQVEAVVQEMYISGKDV